MRIAVSDYDGTIRVGGETRGEVAEAVREWRRAGNLFGLASGRDLSMLDFEIDRVGLEFDFLVCMNGAALYDGDRALLEFSRLDDDLVRSIVSHEATRRSRHFVLLGLGEVLLYDPPGTWHGAGELPHRAVELEEALTARDVGEISFGFEGTAEASAWARALERDFAGRVAAHPNVRMLDINRRGVDKARGIARLLEIKGWSEHPVYAVGDAANDLGMVERYAGCCVPNAIPEVKRVAEREFCDVGDMLRRLLAEGEKAENR